MDENELTEHDLLIRIDQNVIDLRKCQDDHETRLRAVEDWKNQQIGAGVTGGVAGGFGGVIGGFVAVWMMFKNLGG